MLSVLVILAIAGELTFHWVERMAGSYLNRTNSSRKAWGTTWEQADQANKASVQLGSEAAEKAKMRVLADAVTTFAELLDSLEQGDGVELSPSRFIELYRGTPPFLRPQIVDPMELDAFNRGDAWVRTHIQRRGVDGIALLIDRNDSVLQQLLLRRNIMDAIACYAKRTAGTLSDMPKYAGKSFSANRFFELYDQLPDQSRLAIFNDENIILALPKPVVAVGLNAMYIAEDYGTIAFESNPPSGPVVTTYPVLSADISAIYNSLATAVADSLTSASIKADMEMADPEGEQ